MELELKHLAAYLPYNLKVQYVVRGVVEETGVITKITHNEDDTHPTRVGIYYANCEHIWMFKPILKPMSKLTEKEVTNLGFQRLFFAALKRSLKYKKWFDDVPYRLIKYLLSQHYDIFGLIEAGLAVEK